MRGTGVTHRRGALPTVRAAAVVLMAAVLISCSGCSDESLQAFGDALSDAYELYGPGHMRWDEDHPYYEWRQEMHAGSFKGEAYIDLNGGRSLFARGEEEGWPEGPSYEAGSGTWSVYGMASLADAAPDGGEILDPPGWTDARYPGAVDGGYLWRRYELMPEEFGGEYCSDNLRCCTAYAWYAAIRDFEREVRDYLESGPDHEVLYRVTAVSQALERIPQGFLLEARAADGSGLDICRYAYNVQPGVGISYSDGASWLDAAGKPADGAEEEPGPQEEQEPEDGSES